MEETKKVEAAAEQPKKKTTKKKAAPKVIKGIVVNCQKLNVRATPAKTAKVISVLKKDSIVEVDLEKSDKLFYYVKLDSGRTGYCMKQYLKIG